MADQLRGDALFSYAVEHYLDTVYRAAFHAAPSPQDAEDVTQEVFEALLRGGRLMPPPCHPHLDSAERFSSVLYHHFHPL